MRTYEVTITGMGPGVNWNQVEFVEANSIDHAQGQAMRRYREPLSDILSINVRCVSISLGSRADEVVTLLDEKYPEVASKLERMDRETKDIAAGMDKQADHNTMVVERIKAISRALEECQVAHRNHKHGFALDITGKPVPQ